MKVKGIKKAITELNSCPSGFGLMIKLNLDRLEVETSNGCERRSACPSWRELRENEFNLGFFEAPLSQAELMDNIIYCLALARSYNLEPGKVEKLKKAAELIAEG